MTNEWNDAVHEDRLKEMIHLQTELQRRYDHGTFPWEYEGETRANYIRVNVLALEDELHEALREIGWKPWSKTPPGEMNRDAYLDELVDAWHFMMNLLIVANCNAEEFFKRYLRKNGVNHSRIDDGYASPTG